MTTAEPTLYVDLDGTIVSTDMLYESFVSAFRSSPWVAVQAIGWMFSGRAHLKEELARRASIDVATLPYREPVIAFLREERARGRRIVLATASWFTIAEDVARHLGLFDEVLATSRDGNLKGEAKAQRIAEHSGERSFDYIGDSAADLAVWRRCRQAYVVATSDGLAGRIGGSVPVARTFRPEQGGGAMGAMVRALRPHQWAKNLLVLVPLIASHRYGDPTAVLHAIYGFASFCFFASSAYVLNDVLDLGADRAHPRKRLRPFAAGQLSIPAGAVLFVASLCVGALFAAQLDMPFRATLSCYFLLTLAYSLWFKRVVILDVVALAALYTLRVIAGGFAIAAPASAWVLAFAMFLFFSLALVKRYAELVSLESDGIGAAPGRGYAGRDIDIVRAMGTSSAVVSALVLALYVNGEAAANLYSRPVLLWLLCPLFLYWISRMWLLAARGLMHDDPVLFAVTDRASYLVAAIGAAVMFAAI
jgi:4-hydroxybenzoate polyprenyltransferase